MEKNFYKNYFKIEKEHWLMVVRRQIIKDTLCNYLDKEPVETNVLDFGCGSGILVNELATYGYRAYGLDNSEDAITFGKKQGIRNLKTVSTDKLDFQDNTFDAVLSLDVLEHLQNESWALKEMERVVKSGGIVVIMVPAFMFLWGIQDEASFHYRRYTRDSLLKKIHEATNVTVLKASYFNTFLFPLVALVRIMSRALNIQKRESDFDINNFFLNKLFFTIFNTERKILKKVTFPFGVSVLVILQKESS